MGGRGKKPRDRTGDVLGYLTVLGLASGSGRTARWLCRCKCGQTKEISVACLTPTGSRSCGCLQKAEATKAAMRSRFANYKSEVPPNVGAVIDARLERLEAEDDLPW